MNPRASTLFAAAVGAAALWLTGLAGCSSASNGLGSGGNQNCVSTSCGNQSYQECTTVDPTTHACTGVTYSVGGQSFSCASCSDCTQAAQQVIAACEGQSSSGGDGGSGSGSGGGSGSGSGSGGSSGGACSSPQKCGANRTYVECTNVNAGGQCESIVYKTSDGHDFTCPGCTSCASAAEQLQTYCATSSSSSGGGSGSGSGSGSSSGSGSGGETCTSPVACGSGAMTYEECTTMGSGGTCEEMQYKVSDGTVYTCASCSDCTAAVQSLDTYCQDQGTPTTSCTNWTTCGSSSLTYEECTTSLNGSCQSIYYETSDGMSYTCNTCSDCSAALSSMQNHCASQTSTTSCGSATACGNTGVTYQECEASTGGLCTSMYYTTSDGHTYTCNTCSDCSAASTSLQSYCSTLTGTTCGSSTCSSGYLCCNCSGTEECLSAGGGSYTCASYGCQ